MSWADQKWQEYSEAGEPIGKPLSGENAAKGTLHSSAHVWIWRKQGERTEILLQHRAPVKRTWPNMWDISAAGHPDYGESPMQAAIREAKEEIGIMIASSNLNLLFVHRQYMVSSTEPKTIENEFQFVYGYQLRQEAELTLQVDEVDATKWVSEEEFQNMLRAGILVPQGETYFAELFHQLHREWDEAHEHNSD